MSILEEIGQKIRSGENVQFEVDVLTQSGEAIPFEFHSRMIDYQHKPAVLSLARDLSIRKHMEKTLTHSERLSAGIPKTFFMLLTGLDTQLDTDALRASGIDRVIGKPTPADKLFNIIKEINAAPVNAK